jgi:deazaflavin-dependent oxidoreductase (nitroreductase family)
MNDLNEEVIKEFRANRGVVTKAQNGHFKNITLALVHYVGQRTGKERVIPLLCMTDGEDFVLMGSNAGAGREPLWVANLEAMTETSIEFGEQSRQVRPSVLRDGPTYERLYQRVREYWPDTLEYEKHTERSFPLVVLSPVG